MINPADITNIRTGQLPHAAFNGTDNIAHEIGTDLKRGSVDELAAYIASYIGSTDGIAFLPISVTDGQTLPDTTTNEWFLAGVGTYHQGGGFADVVCTEELNVIIGNGTSWTLGVQIPITSSGGISTVTTTVTNILSSALASQTSAGMATWINTHSFTVATNEIKQFHVTDTGQVFELLLRGRSFGSSTPAVSYIDVLDYGGVADMSTLVPYTGATASLNLGEFQAKAGQFELDQTPTGTAGVGIIRWNDTDGTMDIGMKGGNVTLQVGQEQLVRVVNKTGANLTEAQYRCVYISGAIGNRLKVDLTTSATLANAQRCIGIVTEDITNNNEGFVTTNGLVRNINTTGSLQSETWIDGDILYLSSSVAGGLTNITPSSNKILVGYVVRSHATQGVIFVKMETSVDAISLSGNNTWTGIQTFLATKLGLRNVADTFTSFFTNTNTASRTYTLPNRDMTVGDMTTDTSQTFTGTKSFSVASTSTPAFSITNALSGGASSIGVTVANSNDGRGINVTQSSNGTGIYSTNSGASGNGIISVNTNTNSGIYSVNTSTGRGIYSVNQVNGVGVKFDNWANGTNVYLSNEGSGTNLRLEHTTASTGKPFQYTKNSVEKAFINDAGDFSAQKIIANDTVRLKNYTVSTLPTGTQGDMAYVTDATAPTYLGVLIGGGSVVTPVFYNGTAWISH